MKNASKVRIEFDRLLNLELKKKSAFLSEKIYKNFFPKSSGIDKYIFQKFYLLKVKHANEKLFYLKSHEKKLYKIIFEKLNMFVNLTLFSIYYFCFGFYHILKISFLKKKKKLNKKKIIIDFFYNLKKNNSIDNNMPFQIKNFKNEDKIFFIHQINNYKNNMEISEHIHFNTKYKKSNLYFQNFVSNQLNNQKKLFLIKLLIYWFTSPYIISVIIKYLIVLNIYEELIINLNAKKYIASKQGMDEYSLLISNAIKNNNGESFNLQRSFIGNRNQTILTFPCSTLLSWQKGITKEALNDKISEFNCVEKVILTKPYFLSIESDINLLKDNNKNNKIISIFDTAFNEITPFENEVMNSTLENILVKYADRNIFFVIKHKKKNYYDYINKKNLNLIDSLKKSKKLVQITTRGVGNKEIIKNSELTISFNSMSIFAESVYLNTKSCVFLSNLYESKYADLINKTMKCCASNKDDLIIIVKNLLEINNDIDFSAIKNLIFTEIDENSLSII